MVTASHNPKEYNGYKAYWSDGAQMISPHDVKTIEYVNQIKSNDQIKWTPNKDLIQSIGKDIDEQFLADIHTLSLDPEADKRHKDMKIVYTPIHGTGLRLMYDSLKLWGFENVIHVPAQDIQDGDFPTVVSPNPENSEAMHMAVEKAKDGFRPRRRPRRSGGTRQGRQLPACERQPDLHAPYILHHHQECGE